MPQQQPTELVLASNNEGKVREIGQMLSKTGIRVLPQREFGVAEADETGLSFVENAILKARHAAVGSGLAAIADDSGLEVDALNGAPGIYSARYAGPGADDAANNAKLLEALADVTDDRRTARFRCVLAYLRHAHDPTPLICVGSWEGLILRSPRGANGFGYDPLFYLPERRCTSAELEPAVKNALSHRGQALRALVEELSRVAT
jgi:XTP/dITP diphosphohydrolase